MKRSTARRDFFDDLAIATAISVVFAAYLFLMVFLDAGF
jgi:hypothetical protein